MCRPTASDCDAETVPRTVVDTLELFTSVSASNRHSKIEVKDGTYLICPQRLTEEVGGEIWMFYIDPETQRDWNCKPFVGGNPKVFLPDDILEDEKYGFKHVELLKDKLVKGSKTIDLSSVLVPEVTPRSSYYLYLETLQDRASEFCSSIPESGLRFGRILGSFANEIGEKEMVIYDPRLMLQKNYADSPLHDGGGYAELAGSYCSNVPRTFLNEKGCRLSGSACSRFKANARVKLSAVNVKELYNLTGRFVYIITGLRVDEERYHEQSPCLALGRSRWMKIDDDVCDTDAPESAVDEMRWYLIRRYPYQNGLIDVYTGSTVNCIADRTTMGMRVLIGGSDRNPGCWENVHQDLLNVYDVTYWSRPNTHPGNAVRASKGEPNPIKTIAEDEGKATLSFPSWHSMDWWESNKKEFGYVGRWQDEVEYQNLPDTLRFKEVALKFGVANGTSAKLVLVCGSDGEDQDEWEGGIHELFFPCVGGSFAPLNRNLQKNVVWTMMAINSYDQLRQRVAWTLAQLLVVTPNQINEDCASEIYLNYYDIFVKHAFGNYRDVLKEVSYSPMMAEMLSFLNSKSTWYVWEAEGVVLWPDENFSREMMQLFTMGTYLMNRDGSPRLDKGGNTISTYDTDNIVEFARAWTGFTHQERRGNIELDEHQPNRIDPLQIIPEWRDLFPKRDLNGDYLGDTYPLCVDMPDQAFLRKGATFRLLGSSDIPEMRSYFPSWRVNQLIERHAIKYFTVDVESSNLFKKLCPKRWHDGNCIYPAHVRLDANLHCVGAECDLDDLEVVQVEDVFYEYIRAPCVELSLYNDGKYIKQSPWPGHAMCAQSGLAVADAACCPGHSSHVAYRMCEFTGETMSFGQSQKRCARDWFEENQFFNTATCDWTHLNYGHSQDPRCATGHGAAWYWTNSPCALRVKIKRGDIAVVHEVDRLRTSTGERPYTGAPIVSNGTFNYFKVNWLGGNYPDVDENSCADGACEIFEDPVSGDRACMCSFDTTESRVFSRMPSKHIALKMLKIGSFPPDMLGSEVYDLNPDETGRGVSVWHKKGGSKYDGDTIFKVRDEFGRTLYLKNVQSMAKLLGSDKRYWFRNPPRFMSLSMPTVRDAMYETDALLDHYFYHHNVGPFLAQRFIQRFGVSNPSPDFIRRTAAAFVRGSYKHKTRRFGSGSYGDLGAMVASILLDPEMTSPVMDMDPTHGSLREPLVKLIHFMRAMEFRPHQTEIALRGLQDSIGQEAHGMPDVFSFFKPEYQPAGMIRDASLTAPEAQVLTTPNIIALLNGMLALIDIGLTSCYGGFGRASVDSYLCELHLQDKALIPESTWPQSYGFLRWTSESNNTGDRIDRLATLLTAGRLNPDSRRIMNQVMENPGVEEGIDPLKVLQQFFVTTPEFHTTNMIQMNGTKRREVWNPQPSDNPYRAVVYVYLSGGIDSHNVLVPHSNCADKDHYDEYRRVRGTVALMQHELLPINATGSEQVCQTFGVNPDIPILKKLYDEGDLVFFANAGILSDPDVTKDNWVRKVGSRTALFAHNIQQKEVERIDLFDKGFGKGLLGRMVDVLGKSGSVVNKFSTYGVAEALIGDSAVTVLNGEGVAEFNPIASYRGSNSRPLYKYAEVAAKVFNGFTRAPSGLFGETWSSMLSRALEETQRLNSLFDYAKVTEEFPNTRIGKQLAVTARLIKTRAKRGVDRDAYYIWDTGYDTHGNQAPHLTLRLQQVNDALSAFVKEMKNQGIWENVTIVFASEFARTITANSGDGTDHAWGGNYWMAGGSVKGGKIHGKQLDDITEDGPMTIGRGRILIPTLSWDSILYGVMQWMGIKGGMKEVLPNYKKFQGHWLTAQQLFRGDTPACHPRGGACEYDNDCCDGDKCGNGGLCVAAN